MSANNDLRTFCRGCFASFGLTSRCALRSRCPKREFHGLSPLKSSTFRALFDVSVGLDRTNAPHLSGREGNEGKILAAERANQSFNKQRYRASELCVKRHKGWPLQSE